MQVMYLLLLCVSSTQALHTWNKAEPLTVNTVVRYGVEHDAETDEPLGPVIGVDAETGELTRGPYVPVFAIRDKSEAMCIEGTDVYLEQVLDKLLSSNMDIGWRQSEIQHNSCAELGYTRRSSDKLTAGTSLMEETCFPDASVWLDDNHPGFQSMDQRFVDEHNRAGIRDLGGGHAYPFIECLQRVEPTVQEPSVKEANGAKTVQNGAKTCTVTEWSEWGNCAAQVSPTGTDGRLRTRSVDDASKNSGCPPQQDWDYISCVIGLPKEKGMPISAMVDTWRDWDIDPHEACLLWSGDSEWGALSEDDGDNFGTLERSCASDFARNNCAQTCAGYYLSGRALLDADTLLSH